MQQLRKLPWENPADDRLASSTPGNDGLDSAVAAIERVLRGIAAKEQASNSSQDPSAPKRDFSQYMERMHRAAVEIRAAHQRVQTAEVRVNALAQQAMEELEAAVRPIRLVHIGPPDRRHDLIPGDWNAREFCALQDTDEQGGF